MNALLSSARIMLVALTLLYGGLARPPAAQAAGPGGFAANFVGQFYFDPIKLQGFVAGYLPAIDSIPGPLFNSQPDGEGTAFFTFRSDVFQFTELKPNGDLLPFLLSAGANRLEIFFNTTPMGDFTKPNSFSSGQLIATLKSPDGLLLQFISSDPPSGPTPTLPFVLNELPVSRTAVTFNGTTVDFATVAPGGLTLFNTVSTTQLSGNGIGNFTLIFPFAGSGIAVGPTNAAGNPSPAAPVASWNRVQNVPSTLPPSPQ